MIKYLTAINWLTAALSILLSQFLKIVQSQAERKLLKFKTAQAVIHSTLYSFKYLTQTYVSKVRIERGKKRQQRRQQEMISFSA